MKLITVDIGFLLQFVCTICNFMYVLNNLCCIFQKTVSDMIKHYDSNIIKRYKFRQFLHSFSILNIFNLTIGFGFFYGWING